MVPERSRRVEGHATSTKRTLQLLSVHSPHHQIIPFSHPLIFPSSHLLIFSSSHPLIFSFSHFPIFPFSHFPPFRPIPSCLAPSAFARGRRISRHSCPGAQLRSTPGYRYFAAPRRNPGFPHHPFFKLANPQIRDWEIAAPPSAPKRTLPNYHLSKLAHSHIS